MAGWLHGGGGDQYRYLKREQSVEHLGEVGRLACRDTFGNQERYQAECFFGRCEFINGEYGKPVEGLFLGFC